MAEPAKGKVYSPGPLFGVGGRLHQAQPADAFLRVPTRGPTMDKYRTFEALCNAEKVGIDFDIVQVRRRGAQVVIIAPHGGGIEPRTSEIAREIAGESFSYYAFER